MNNRKLFISNIGDLAEAQRASYYSFLFYGISEEVSHFPNPFMTNIQVSARKRFPCLVYLFPHEIKIKGPNASIEFCLKRDMSYTIQIYIAGEYSYPTQELEEGWDTKTRFTTQSTENLSDEFFPKKKNKHEGFPEFLNEKFSNREFLGSFSQIRVKQDIFFGEIPFMTEEGTFLINGCERIVISQIIRSPGIYFRKEFGSSKNTLYTATVISNKGLWTRFIYDTCKEEETQKVKSRIYMKLNDYKRRGASTREKKGCDDTNKLFLLDFLKYFGLNLEEVYDSLKYPLHLQIHDFEKKDRIFPNLIKELEISSLMKRLFLNQRTGCFSIGEIGRYKINKRLGLNLPKDITYLTAHDFIRILDGLIELKYYNKVNDDIDDLKNKMIRSVGELLQNQIRVGIYRLQKNILENASISVSNNQKINFDLESVSDPEDWILDPRPLTNSIRDFFKTSQLSQYMDQINPLAELTHKRRISVFGPNGLKRDHISTVIRDIHPSQYGRLCPVETPEGQNAGLIASVAMYGRIGSLGTIETPYFLMKEKIIYAKNHPLFLNPDQEAETKVAFCDFSVPVKKEVKLEDQGTPLLRPTPLSYSGSLDFLSVKENDFFSLKKFKDINFLTTSPLQIISLATALIPFIEHNDANRALMGSNMQRQAVPLLYTQKPIVGTGLESVAILDSGMVVKSYSQGKVKFSSSSFIQIEDFGNQIITYFLKKYNRSNQETSMNQKPIVWEGEDVFSGQIIADGPGTQDGELALGKNLTLAYMPWEGYNFEDAIVINERLLLNDSLTSVHIEEYETNLTYCTVDSEKMTKDLPHLTKYSRRHLNKEGIIRIGSYVKEGDILVGKFTPCEDEPCPEHKLLEVLYGRKEKNYRDTSLKVASGAEGRVVDIRIISSLSLNKDEILLGTSCEMIRIYIAQIRKIQVGDKLAGRHGNKGIVSRILPQQDMPYLPDGTPIDILFNPLGVPSRMNVGQVFECLLGLAGEKLGKRFRISPFDEIYGVEASRVLTNQKLKQASQEKNYDWVFHSSFPGKILLRDGRTGEFFDNPITVGKSYILKLIHLVEDKIHARATGPYAMITEQPLAGKSQKGGQRFGEMEVWAIEAYGCSYTLQELLTIKSDDIDGRNDMYESILVRKNISKPNPSIPESFLTLVRELHALGLDFSFQKIVTQTLDPKKIGTEEKDVFEDMESRLKLRALLSRNKIEQLAKVEGPSSSIYIQKQIEKEAIVENWKEYLSTTLKQPNY
jgi:DNA-directed RNA polymerase subunit beta